MSFSFARCRRWNMPTATTAWTPVSASPTVSSSLVTLPLQPIDSRGLAGHT